MDAWFAENGRPVLEEAIANAVGRVDEAFRKDFRLEMDHNHEVALELGALRARAATIEELERRNDALRDELQALKDRTASIEKLEQQNKALRNELEAYERAHAEKAVTSATSGRAGLASDMIASASHSRMDRDNVPRSEYERIYQRYMDAIEANDKFQEWRNEHAENVEKWRIHAETLSKQSLGRLKKLKRLRSELATAKGTTVDAMIALEGDITRDSSAPVEHVLREAEEMGSRATAVGNGEGSRTAVPPPTSSQDKSTQSDPEVGLDSPERMHPLAKPRSPDRGGVSGDGVESSPSLPAILSERMVGKRKRGFEGPAEVPTPARIKMEHSSSPVITNETYRFTPHESIDFDAVATELHTPRKLRAPQGAARLGQTSPSKCTAIRQVSTLGYGHGLSNSSALLPLDINLPNSGRGQWWSEPRGNRHSRLLPGIENLAEDGEDLDFKVRPSTPAQADGRLTRLLNSAKPEREAIKLLNDPRRQGKHGATMSQEMVPPRALPFGKDASENRSRPPSAHLAGDQQKGTPKRRSPQTNLRPHVKQGVQRLRDQPISSLQTADFKVNPKHNAGEKFAFTEIVRDREGRMSLPGSLSGLAGDDYRRQARLELGAIGPRDVHTFLESYFGDQRSKLGRMTREEKDFIWVEIKAQEFSDTYGRNRERFPRMRSPPGHWNMDFPSTQEELHYKAEAGKQERGVVEARHREAMKPDGRWLFRDE